MCRGSAIYTGNVREGINSWMRQNSLGVKCKILMVTNAPAVNPIHPPLESFRTSGFTFEQGQARR